MTWWLLLNLGTIRATSSLLKKCDDRTDKRTERQQKSYIPQSFFGGGIQILSKINFKNFKKKTEKKHIPDLVQAFTQENGGF